jgi:hypothetical protein
MDPSVLFIHPYNHMEPEAVPIGSVGLVNLLPGKALGRYASEVTPDEIRAARVILIDVHWFFPLAILDGMLAAIRRINPGVKVIVGGIASSFYREVFFERYPADYVIAGDVELSLPPLVAHLLAGEAPPPLPNVWTSNGPLVAPRDGVLPARIDAQGFDDVDWLTIDWFPAYREIMLAHHALYRSQIGEAAPLCYPYLPVTRGCRRACEFCYGAYHEQVFGRGIRMRSPEALLRDLARISADPDLRFVSILFADEGLMAPYAPFLADKRFPLDAFLYFCGNADPEVVAQVRSGFAGAVNFSVIQPSDLAPLPSDPPKAEQRAAFAALVKRFEQMDRTGVVFYHIHEPPEPEAAAHDKPGSPIKPDSGTDWAVIRPNSFDLKESYGLREQLLDVVAAGRCASSLHVVRLLVPTLRPVLDVALYRDVYRERDGGDPLATRVLATYARGLREKRVYGFEGVRLGLRRADRAGWARPGAAVEGACSWTLGLNGFGWEATLEVDESGPLAVAPCPTILAWGDEPIDLATWPKAIVPAVAIPRGPRRTVRVGGATEGARLVLWVEDGGARTEHRLEHGIGLIEAEAATTQKHVPGRVVSPDADRRIWADRSLPVRIVEELRARPAESLTPALALTYYNITPTCLELELRGEDGLEVAVVVFPREPGMRYLGSPAFAFAYRVAAGTADLGPFQRAFTEALRRAEQRVRDAVEARRRVTVAR